MLPLLPLLWMAASFLLLFILLVLVRTETEIDRRRLEIRKERMNSYAVFIISAYLAVFMILGGLTIASLSARNKARRELAARGLDRPREQRAKVSG